MTSWHLFPKDRLSAGPSRRVSECSFPEAGSEDVSESDVGEENLSFLDSYSQSHRDGGLSPNLIRRFLATSLAPSVPDLSLDQDDCSNTSSEERNASARQQNAFGSRLANDYLPNTINPFSDPISDPHSPLKTSPFPDMPADSNSRSNSRDCFSRAAIVRAPSNAESRYSSPLSIRRPSSPFNLESEPLLAENPYKPLTPNSISQNTGSECLSQHTAPVRLQDTPRRRPRTPPLKSTHTSVSSTLPGTPTPSLSRTISTALSPTSSYSALTANSGNSSSPATVMPESPLVRTRFSDSIAKPKTRDLPIGDELRYHNFMASYHHRRATSSVDSPAEIRNDKSIPSCLGIPTDEPFPQPHAKPRTPQAKGSKTSAQNPAPAFVFPPTDYAPAPSPSFSTHTATPTNACPPSRQAITSLTPNAPMTFPILFPLLSDTKSPNGNVSGFDWDESPSSPPKVPFMKKVKSLGNLTRSGSRSRSRGRMRTRASSRRAAASVVAPSQPNTDRRKGGAMRLSSRSASPWAASTAAGDNTDGERSVQSVSPTSPGPSVVPPMPMPVPVPVPVPSSRETRPTGRITTTIPSYPLRAVDPTLLQQQTAAAYAIHVPLPTPPPTTLTAPGMPSSPPGAALTAAPASVATTASGTTSAIVPPRKKKLAKPQPQPQPQPQPHALVPVPTPVTSTSMDTPVPPLPPAPPPPQAPQDIHGGTATGPGLLRRCCRKMKMLMLGREKSGR